MGTDLIRRIIAISRGGNARIAAAFWSEKGLETLLGKANLKARIVCDISIGSTSSEALRALGAPARRTLRHAERMHAKVFLSDDDLVVASANVSQAALGHGSRDGWQIEAGTFHPAGSTAWTQAMRWFDELYGVAVQVNEAELARAQITYRPPPPQENAPAPRAGSLLDIVTTSPDRFNGVSFVFTRRPSDEDAVKGAKESAKSLETGLNDAEIQAWADRGIFTGWEKEDVRSWQTLFVSIWVGPRAVSITGYRTWVPDQRNGSVMSRSDWTAVKRSVGIDLPDRRLAAAADGAAVRAILGDNDGAFFPNGRSLAEKVKEFQTPPGRRKRPAA